VWLLCVPTKLARDYGKESVGVGVGVGVGGVYQYTECMIRLFCRDVRNVRDMVDHESATARGITAWMWVQACRRAGVRAIR
jgi:hypothetical protein